MYAGTCGKNGAAADNLTFYPEKYIDKMCKFNKIINHKGTLMET